MSRMEQKVSKGEGTWIDWQYLLDAVGLLRKVSLELWVGQWGVVRMDVGRECVSQHFISMYICMRVSAAIL